MFQPKLLQRTFRYFESSLGTSRGQFRLVRFLATLFVGLRRYRACLTNGSEIVVDLRESMCFPLFLRGCIPHEVSEKKILERLTRPGDVFVDVGANVGFYTAHARDWVGPSGMVLAFEPNPICVKLLRESFSSKPNVAVVPVGLGMEDSIGVLRVPPRGDLAAFHRISTEACRTFEAKIVRLDSFFAAGDFPKPAVVKIDCEGMEFDVVRGMEGLLRGTCPPILAFEYIESFGRERGFSLLEVERYLQRTSEGTYRLFRVDYDGKLRSENLDLATAQNDLIAIPKCRGDRLACAAA